MIKLFKHKKECTACTACKHICPREAIEMVYDDEGFYYPEIDHSKCIECKKCLLVCPLKNYPEIKEHYDIPRTYATKHKSPDVRNNSSSGGVFTAISDEIIANQGLVCGAAFDSNFKVVHTFVKDTEGRNKLRGSKYVQSDLRDVFLRIGENIKENRTVLFTGTPCQTAGLFKYLELKKISTEKLVVCDIICHGTPSPKVWKEYVLKLTNNFKNKIVKYTFRDKTQGWRGYNVRVKYYNGEVEVNTDGLKTFTKLYSSNLILRPSCYECIFANINRPSDIMIGDFWGIEKSLNKFDDNMGVSLVFVNTRKGSEVFDNIKDSLIVADTSLEECMQLNLQKPTSEPLERKKFWIDYHKKGYLYVESRYTKKTFTRRIMNKLRIVLNKINEKVNTL